MLTCDDLSITIEQNNLFAKLGFTLFEGGLMAIQGANGSGKTTLLKLLAGLLKPDQGKIEWFGHDINNDKFYFDSIAYLGHNLALWDDLTVLDNIGFWANLRNSMELILPAIHHFGLNDYMDVRCKKLSSGLKKRVALAKIMAIDAKLWILDEPDNNLDKTSRDLLIKLIETKLQSGGMIIMTSHNVQNLPLQSILNIEDF